jgi:hypothetical protein
LPDGVAAEPVRAGAISVCSEGWPQAAIRFCRHSSIRALQNWSSASRPTPVRLAIAKPSPIPKNQGGHANHRPPRHHTGLPKGYTTLDLYPPNGYE